MARAKVLGRLNWQVATVADVRVESVTAATLVLEVNDWPGHLAGQHVDLRLTAEDGYTAQRSYSIASSAADDRLELTIDHLPDGEVSTYLTQVVEVGDQLEIRGPLGGWFVWDPVDSRPVLLVGGGSGLVPLMAMMRTHRNAPDAAPFHLVYSTRNPGESLFAGELDDISRAGSSVAVIYTRTAPPNTTRPPSRITAADLDVPGFRAADAPAVFVCGSNGFVEAAANLLLALGHSAANIKTERFGPTGGQP
ncbi:ferredoxin reductase [Antrihabitans sp. NCIMB 15449]|uniref:Ferredoxin reductase n=1 Tax=Antrihabitans spumae TaxID=3373370 RepID=A0ABW7JNL8_9NOCA